MVGDSNFNFSEQDKVESSKINIDNLNVFEMEYYEINDILTLLSDNDKIKFFDKLLEKIKSNPDNKYFNNLHILSLPPEIRTKYVDYFNFEYFGSINSFVDGMTNENDIFNVAKIGLDKIKNYNSYLIFDLFCVVPNNKKIEFLKLIAKKEKQTQTDIINNTNITEYLKQFNIEQRLDIVKNVIFKDFQVKYEENYMNMFVPSVRFDSYSYMNILNAFSDENNPNLSESKMFQTLVFLTEESKKIHHNETDLVVGIAYPETIVKIFYEHGYNPKEIMRFLINNNAIDKEIGLSSIVENLPREIRKDLIDFMINLDNEERKMSEFEFFSSLNALSQNDAKELFIKYCLIDKKFDYLFAIKRSNNKEGYSSFDYLKIIFETLSLDELETSFEKIKIAFSEILTYPNYDEKYDVVVSFFSKKYNVDENKVLPFVEKFGYNILKYLEYETIRKFINTDSKNREKIFNLFCDNTIVINKSITNDILNSLLQRQFMLEENKTYNIFSIFETLVLNNDLNGIHELLKKISKEFDYSLILQKNNCSMDDLYNQIIAGNLDLLHIITDGYIAYKREIFVKEKLQNVNELLLMEQVITRESYKSEMIKNSTFNIINSCKQLASVSFTEEQKYLIDNYDLMDELMQFKRDPKGYNLDNKYKRYLKVLNELLEIMYDNKVDFIFYNVNSILCKHLKFEFVQGKIPNDFLIGILLESNYEGVMNLLANDTNYTSLKTYLEKYKIVGWKDIFSNLIEKADMQFDEGTIANLISNYDKIKPYIDNKASLTSVIDYANCYSTFSTFYRKLFGMEDYNLLAANAGKNKASVSKYYRLNGCRDLIPFMYGKKSFTVPTIDENFTLKSGKDIQIVLGNATNMMNLTYGERTDACMRKGGAFNDLFEHCIKDANGFHIRFVNPKTGNFVSRVSGTRNGNTIFLNELRNSLDPEYNNEDLYEAIKTLSKYLIQLSKNSKVPIDNIIVTSDYALEEHKDENQRLNLSPEERQNALRKIPFNFTDIGILLANSKNDNEIMPYIFSNNVPYYDTVRDNIKVYYGTSAVNRMIQIRIINDVINGVLDDNINTDYVGELPDYIISGEDYYIAYNKGNIDTFILDSRKENERTIYEIDNILKNNTNILDDSTVKGVSK